MKELSLAPARALLAVCVAVSPAVSAAWAEKPTAAVLPLRPVEGSEAFHADFEEAVRAALATDGRWTLLPPEKVVAALERAGLHSPLACARNLCLLEAGRILGVTAVFAADLLPDGPARAARLRQVEVHGEKVREVAQPRSLWKTPAGRAHTAERLVEELQTPGTSLAQSFRLGNRKRWAAAGTVTAAWLAWELTSDDEGGPDVPLLPGAPEPPQ